MGNAGVHMPSAIMLLISEFSEMSIVGKELCRDQRGEGGTETSL